MHHRRVQRRDDEDVQLQPRLRTGSGPGKRLQGMRTSEPRRLVTQRLRLHRLCLWTNRIRQNSYHNRPFTLGEEGKDRVVAVVVVVFIVVDDVDGDDDDVDNDDADGDDDDGDEDDGDEDNDDDHGANVQLMLLMIMMMMMMKIS